MVKAKTVKSDDWSYEAKVGEVEKIISQIEAGELELDEVFQQFSIAVQSLRECEDFLHKRQEQVELLIETLGKDE
jgi:exodeoxyribonuclease VII small subunit